MQRLAFLSFLGVLLLLLAFTAHETKKPASACSITGKSLALKTDVVRH